MYISFATSNYMALKKSDEKNCPSRITLFEPDALKGARPVLRGGWRSNTLSLPNRQADLIRKTASEREALADAEKGLRDAQLELDIATLRIQEATMLLKVAESTSQ